VLLFTAIALSTAIDEHHRASRGRQNRGLLHRRHHRRLGPVAAHPAFENIIEYREKTVEELAHHHISNPDRIVFLEITITDPSGG
jgi:hypothetical protein